MPHNKYADDLDAALLGGDVETYRKILQSYTNDSRMACGATGEVFGIHPYIIANHTFLDGDIDENKYAWQTHDWITAVIREGKPLYGQH